MLLWSLPLSAAGQVQCGDDALTQSLLRVVCYMAADPAALPDMFHVSTVYQLQQASVECVACMQQQITYRTFVLSECTLQATC